jgi:hypothetical protein
MKTPKKQSNAAGSRAKVDLKDLKPKKDAKGGASPQLIRGVRVAAADLAGDN